MFRRGEVLPEGRTNEEEMRLIQKDEQRARSMEARSQTVGKVLTAQNAKSAEDNTRH